MSSNRRAFLKTVTAGAVGSTLAAGSAAAHDFPPASKLDSWAPDADRVFVGPQFWANRLQDWRVKNGRVECGVAKPGLRYRTLHLLTRRAGEAGDVFIRVRCGRLGGDQRCNESAAAGVLVGAGGGDMDYRTAALVHQLPGPGGGHFFGVSPDGKVTHRAFEKAVAEKAAVKASDGPAEIILELTVGGDGVPAVAADAETGKETDRRTFRVGRKALAGNVALVSHPGKGRAPAAFWFRDLHIDGPGVTEHDGDTVGPIFCTQYTVSRGVLKLTAQLLPIGGNESQQAELRVKTADGWHTAATAKVVTPGYTATFRVADWDDSMDHEYNIVYSMKGADGRPAEHTWAGTVRRDPKDAGKLTLVNLNCVQQILGNLGARRRTYGWSKTAWFPHTDMVPNVARQKPDLLFFAGDQIYEGCPTPTVRNPLEEAYLDYLYKWYLWCWTYRDLTKDIPSVCIPDDHDVYQGNIWGDGGEAAEEGDRTGLRGGYGMPASWVNMIQRTQASHLPDPFDAKQAAGRIDVYYTSLVWGGVGFAILEDRKFKSPPRIIDAKMTRDSHIIEKNYDTRKADKPGAQLLGERQEKFLDSFVEDWAGQRMKAALSQTIFCNLQISSRGVTKGELDRDLDSNGWPQSGRRRALERLRRAFVIHIAGDQHLPSVVEHGLDEFGDAVWSFCAPAAANFYTRFWNPDYKPQNADEAQGEYLGDYEDGFRNKVTVRAIANPTNAPEPGQFPEPVELHRKSPGYGVIRFDTAKRAATLECWPRHADPSAGGKQYDGWPVEVPMLANGRRPKKYLPTLKFTKTADPVVRVVDEPTGEVLYVVRAAGGEFRPPAFGEGPFTVTAAGKTLKGVKPGRGSVRVEG